MCLRLLFAAVSLLGTVALAQSLELGLPLACTPGTDCFVQQFPDVDAGPDAVDPFCGTATYNGHDGVDLRVLSMAEMARGVAVVAMADGTVQRLRNNVPDRLVASAADQAAVANIECGNGMLVDLGEGFQAQYCHMKQGGIAVTEGQTVKRGERLGDVGASGMAQFPHVHVTIRQNGAAIDPMSGRPLGQGCSEAAAMQPLWAPDVAAALGRGDAQILAIGLAEAPIDHSALTVSGTPAAATAASPNHVGWAWMINLRQGDRVKVRLTGPDGVVVAEQTSEPMDRGKADWSAFAGKRGAPASGEYEIYAAVIRDGKPVAERRQRAAVK